MREPLPEARNPPAPGGAGPRATPPMQRGRSGAPYGPSDSRTVDVAVPERYAGTVRTFAAWLEAGPNPSSLRYSKKGRQIVARLELSGEPERVMAQAREAGAWT